MNHSHIRTLACWHARLPARPHARSPACPHARTPSRPHARTLARPHECFVCLLGHREYCSSMSTSLFQGASLFQGTALFQGASLFQGSSLFQGTSYSTQLTTRNSALFPLKPTQWRGQLRTATSTNLRRNVCTQDCVYSRTLLDQACAKLANGKYIKEKRIFSDGLLFN